MIFSWTAGNIHAKSVLKSDVFFFIIDLDWHSIVLNNVGSIFYSISKLGLLNRSENFISIWL
mgnify:CR=1 FL=1